MKKIYSLALVLALLLSLSTPALAEEPSQHLGALGNTDVSVSAVYEAGIEGGTVYSVDIAWEDMSFTYKCESADTWDPINHTYNSTAEDADWTEESVGTITVTNHSNAFIMLHCNYVANDGFEQTGMQFAYSLYDRNSHTDGVVYSAEIGNVEHATTITVKPYGTLPSSTTSSQAIGSITVSINPWEEIDAEAASEYANNASSTLGDYSLGGNELQNAQSAISKLETTATTAESGQRSDLLAMMEAYIELSTLMVNLDLKYGTTP